MSALNTIPDFSVTLLLVGVLVLFSYGASRILAKAKIPPASGFIISGIILGNILIQQVHPTFTEQIRIVSDFALGLIDFEIGSQLKIKKLIPHLPQYFPILLAESVGTFFIVSFVMTLWFHNLALGLLFGAMSSSTAPAVTLRVIWETKSECPLTDVVYFLLAADDFTALFIATFVLEIPLQSLLGTSTTFAAIILTTLEEIVFSILIGSFFGYVLQRLMKDEKAVGPLIVLIVGVIFIILGLSELVNANIILTCMILGLVAGNTGVGISEHIKMRLEGLTRPVIVFFSFLLA